MFHTHTRKRVCTFTLRPHMLTHAHIQEHTLALSCRASPRQEPAKPPERPLLQTLNWKSSRKRPPALWPPRKGFTHAERGRAGQDRGAGQDCAFGGILQEVVTRGAPL